MTTDFASRQRYEQAQADARKAEAEAQKDRAALAAAQSQLGVLQSQRREEEARLEQARANLRLVKNDLDNTVIRAPVSGIAGNRAGQVGQYVKPGTELVSLVPLPRVYVTANFKETQLTRMRPGQRAEVSVDAYPDQTLIGKIESFAPASGAQFSLLPPDNATGNFTKIVQRVPVRIALPKDGTAGAAAAAGTIGHGHRRYPRHGRRDRRRRHCRDGPGQPRSCDGRRYQVSWAPAVLRRAGWPRRSPILRVPAAADAMRLATPPAATAPPGPAGQQTLRDWIGVLAMSVGLFMAIMDVQIVTSSLTQIQGGLSASSDEISWVQTAYLIADVVMVPLSGMLSRLVSTRLLFVTAILGFTAASALCATATSLSQMIVFRAMQGFCGGAITPSVFPVIYTRFRGPAADAADGDDLGHPEPVIDARADDRRVPDRHPLVALAVSRQHRARHCRRRGRLELRQHRQARPVAAALFRRDRAGADGDLSRLSRIRARRRAAVGLARRHDDPRRGRRVGDGLGVVLLAGADLPAADRRFARLQQPQFRARLVLYIPRRHRDVQHDVSGPAVSGASARLQRAADRRDGLCRRDRADGDVAVQHSDRPADRFAADAGVRSRAVCVLDVSDRRPHQSGRAFPNSWCRKRCAASR